MLIPKYVLKSIELLDKSNFDSYIVGGCIRDMMLHKKPSDWDITTIAKPDELKKVFSDYRVIETGIKHGTLTVIIDEMPLEITTFRTENKYVNNRKPETVTFVNTIEEDLSRRDFTINSLAYHPQKGILDMFGGKNDIDSKLIRSIGNPDKRFEEDALRILRALRFSSTLGFKIESKTQESIFKNRMLLKNISAERIREEFTKILCGNNVGYVLKNYSDVIKVFIPEIESTIGFDQQNDYHIYDVWNHTIKVVENIRNEKILRWSAFLHDLGKPDCFSIDENNVGHFYSHEKKSEKMASEILNRLKFDNNTKYIIKKLVLNHQKEILLNKKSVKRQLNKLGEKTLFLLIELFIADAKGQNPKYINRLEKYRSLKSMVENIVDEKDCFSLKDLLIDGTDLIRLGFKGKEIGDTLKIILNEVIDENLKNDRKILLKKANEIKNKNENS